MADDFRTCRRTGCRWPAVASLSYRYATRQVWVLDLTGELDPSCYDLCPHHADTLTVPNGWEFVDERTRPAPIVEPPAPQRAHARPVLVGAAAVNTSGRSDQSSRGTPAVRPTPRRTPVPSWHAAAQPSPEPRHDRYAALHADLPRLASEESGPGAPYLEPSARHPSSGMTVTRDTPRESTAILSRELAPVPSERAEVLLAPAPPEVEGQLTMPVSDAREAGAVVVSIERHRRQPDDRVKG